MVMEYNETCLTTVECDMMVGRSVGRSVRILLKFMQIFCYGRFSWL